MKRKLSLLLAVVMILGSFSFAFANEDVKPADFLEDKGVLLGDESGDLMLDKPLERRDAVVMLSRLLGVEKEAKAFEEEGLPTWEDNNDKYYNGFLAWAQSNEYFEGHSEEKFGPRDNITVREYAVVLLRALGYKEEAGVWKEVFDTAKKLGLLEGLDKEADDEILRGEMADMTFIALGTKMKGSDKTLADELGIEMPAPKELKAVVNDTENLKEVVVELSNAKLADAEKLVDEDNYRIDKIKVDNVTVDGDNVILLLDKALVKGRSYDLNIRNIDKAINGKYSFKANDNASPKVESVEVLGEYGIKVTVSEPVDNPRERDFLIDGKNVAMNLETYGRDIILTPYHKTAFSANAETLTVKELEDFAGYKASLEDFDIEIAKDEVAPEVVDVVVKGNLVEVTFDKDIYKDSVEGYENRKDVGNISYRSGRHDIYTVDKGAKKVDTNKVVYEFKEDLPRRTEVTIVDVQNHSKVTMEKTTVEAREIKDNTEPEIIDVDVDKTVEDEKGKSSAKITLEFDKNVYGYYDEAKKEFNVDKHFALYVEEVLNRNEITKEEEGKIVSAKYDGDKKDTIVVEIVNLTKNNNDKDYDYILEVVNFEDSSRNRMYRDYVDFEIKADKTLSIKGIDVYHNTKKDETEIAIEFNRAVDRVRAEDKTNYLFRKNSMTDKPKDVADLDGEIIVEKDGEVVTLVLPEFKDEGYKYLEVLRALRDKDGNKLVGSTIYDLNTEKAVEIVETIPEEKSAITYIYATEEKTALELPVNSSASGEEVTVKYVNVDKTGKTLTARLVIEDENGPISVDPAVALTEAAAPNLGTFTADVDIDALVQAAGTYTLKVTIEGETSALPITILDTDAKLGSLKILGKVVPVATLNSTQADDVTLPYGKTTDNVNVSDIVAEAVSEDADVKVEKAGSLVTIIVTPKSGATDKVEYVVTLKQQAKVTASDVAVAGTDGSNQFTVTIANSTGINMNTDLIKLVSVKDSASAVKNVKVLSIVELPDGTYTVVLDTSLATGDVITVTVDGVEVASAPLS